MCPDKPLVTATLIGTILALAQAAAAQPLQGPDKPYDRPAVMVTMDGIYLVPDHNGDWRALLRFKGFHAASPPLVEGRVASENVQGFLIPKLYEKLKALRSKKQTQKGKSNHAINLLIDPRIPGQTAAQVMYTLGQAEYAGFAVVLADSSPVTALRIALPKIGAAVAMQDKPRRDAISLTLFWGAQGMQVSAQGIALREVQKETSIPGASSVGLAGAMGGMGGMGTTGDGSYEDCDRVMLNYREKCPPVARSPGQLDTKALHALAQSLCAGGTKMALMLLLIRDAPFGELMAAALSVYSACGIRPVMAVDQGSGESEKCDASQSAAQVKRRLATGWCQRKKRSKRNAYDGTLMNSLAASGGGAFGGGVGAALTGKRPAQRATGAAKGPGVATKKKASVRLKVLGVENEYESGGLNKKTANRYLKRRRGAFRMCFERALQKSPTLAGTLKFKIVVNGARGRVMKVQRTAGTLKEASVKACMLRSARRVRFPHFDGVADVEVLFQLKK